MCPGFMLCECCGGVGCGSQDFFFGGALEHSHSLKRLIALTDSQTPSGVIRHF